MLASSQQWLGKDSSGRDLQTALGNLERGKGQAKGKEAENFFKFRGGGFACIASDRCVMFGVQEDCSHEFVQAKRKARKANCYSVPDVMESCTMTPGQGTFCRPVKCKQFIFIQFHSCPTTVSQVKVVVAKPI